MAIGRLSVCTGAKGRASAHAQYIAREGRYEKDPEIEKLEHTESGNMPKWAESDPNFFWQMSDEHERKNGSTYREHVITLPRELNESQRLALIHDWIKQEIGDKFAYQFAIHTPKAMDGLEQPHCHLMFSERTIDGIERDPDQYFRRYNSKNPERGGAKKANTGIPPAERKAELSEQRDRWEKICNKHLELANSEARISMKSLKEQGIERKPVNFSMVQIQTPEIKAVYVEDLTAQRSYTSIEKDRDQIDIPIEMEMQSRQKRLADIAKMREAAQQKTAQQAAEKATQERLARQAAERAAQARQAAEKAAQARQAAEKAAQARQEAEKAAQARQAAEKAAQARQAQQAAEKAAQARQAAEKAAQARQAAEKAAERLECGRIESRTAHKLLKLNLSVKIMQPSSHGHKPTLLKNAIAPIGKNLYLLLQQADNKGYDIIINNRDGRNNPINPETATNPTAMAFERFMLRAEVLSNPDIYNDFVVRLGIREFADKYGLTCNSEDLNQLDKLNPDPKMNVPQPQPENKVEPQSTNNYDFYL